MDKGANLSARAFTAMHFIQLYTSESVTYLLTIGAEGVPELAKNAVLNANYMMEKLKDYYPMAYDHTCMHEFVMPPPCGVENVLCRFRWMQSKPISPGRTRPITAFRFAPS